MGQMAIAMTLRGFNDLGRSVTPIFFRWVIIRDRLFKRRLMLKQEKKLKDRFFLHKSVFNVER